jgi:hypothetical protein
LFGLRPVQTCCYHQYILLYLQINLTERRTRTWRITQMSRLWVSFIYIIFHIRIYILQSVFSKASDEHLVFDSSLTQLNSISCLRVSSSNCIVYHVWEFPYLITNNIMIDLIFGVLTLLSTIYQLYHGDQF